MKKLVFALSYLVGVVIGGPAWPITIPKFLWEKRQFDKSLAEGYKLLDEHNQRMEKSIWKGASL